MTKDREAYAAWMRRVVRPPQGRLEDQPARRSVRAVEAAWRTGLETVIVLPYAVRHAERITSRHLVVSDAVSRGTASRERALALAVGEASDGGA